MSAAITVVLVLVLISPDNRRQKSGFRRKFTSTTLLPLYRSENVKGLRSICGVLDNHIYFETDTAGNIIETDSTLLNKRFLKFEIPDEKTVASLYTTFIDSAYCYILAGNVPGMIRFNMGKPSGQLSRFPGHLFSQSVISGNGNVVLRMYQKAGGKWDQVFTSWNPVSNELFTKENVTKKRGDAGFSTDGMLLFDKSTSNILYVPYYSNEFICMDTLLHVLYKRPTINRFSNPGIKVVSERSAYFRIITNESPLHEVNLQSKAGNNRLYIHSAVPADNERRKDFANGAVIDTYQISDGHYLGSFYIPKYKEEKLRDFDVRNDKIIVLYNHYIITYLLPLNL